MTTLLLPKSAHIIVVGGSLAGLMAAIPLKRLGYRVTIFERSPVALLHDQGAGIVAGGDTLRWVQTHGHPNTQLDGISVLSQWRYYLDRQGNVIDKESSQQRMTSWGVLYNIGRDNFDRRDSIQNEDEIVPARPGSGEGRYEYGRTVSSVEETSNGVKVHFKQVSKDSQSEVEGSVEGDFLIVADGPSSHLRRTLLGQDTASRTYAGYVAFRGTVPESELSGAAIEVFVQKFSFFHGTKPKTQILAYTIPNADGSLVEGERLVNWVWYHNVAFDSDEYAEIMTDNKGTKHRFTLPTGGVMQSQVWERQKRTAGSRLPPQFAELVLKTEKPFVQAITDLKPPKTKSEAVRLLGGKALIMGDAYSGFRPHTAASTTQAAFQALQLEDVFKGGLNWDEYEASVHEFASLWQRRGVYLGDRSQFGDHPLAS